MRKTSLIITLFLLLPFLSKAQEDNWESLNNKILDSYNQGSYHQALEYAILAEKQALKEFGANDSAYFVSLNNLGVVNSTLGNYPEAETYYLKVKELREKKFGKEHHNYALSINNLATFYWQLSKFPKAEALYIEAMEIRARVVGTKSPDYAQSVSDLAGLYTDIGKYKEAEELYSKSLKIYENSAGKKSHLYAENLLHLAELYLHMSRFSEAELLLLEVMQIYKGTMNENSQNYILALNSVGVLYYEMGNYEKARDLLYEVKGRIENVFGKENTVYSTALANLSVIELNKNNITLAKELIQEAIRLIELILGKETRDYADAQMNLSNIFVLEKKYDDALQVATEAKNIYERIATKNSSKYAKACDKISDIYYMLGNIEQAIALSSEAKEIFENTIGVNNLNYINSIKNLAFYYQIQNKNSIAEQYFAEMNALNRMKLIENFGFTNEEEKNKLMNAFRLDYNGFQAFALNYQNEKPEFINHLYNNELLLKGIVLQSEINIRNAINNSKDTALQHEYSQLSTLKNYLRKQYVQNATKEQTKPFEQQAEALEKQIARKTTNLPEFKNLTINTNWQDIQKALKPDEIAIEYTTFQYKDKDRWADSIYTCALILRKDYKYPKMVYMFEEKELIKTLQNSNNQNNSPNDLYAARGIIKLVINSQPLNEKLYKLIWQPIESELNGIKHLYLAPSGLLHNVSFAALSIGDSLYLSDKYSINTVSSTAAILNKQKLNAPENIVLYGGINYDLDTLVMANNSKLYEVQHNVLAARAVSELESVDNWNYLNGTKSEIDIIAQFFSKKKKKTTVFSNQLANEESFKALSGKKTEVIHLATHGFYFEKQSQTAEELNKQELLQNQNIFKTSENPLLRSGLLFAGANRAWNKKSIPENVEDGILTSYEVSQMNLSNVKLVTLSACQTGLGDVYIGEGVIGLQRAFKMAGVQNLIVSLWSIPDKETVEFMELFYKNWLKTNDIQNAFRKAQSTMRKKYPPYYWAAFKLVN